MIAIPSPRSRRSRSRRSSPIRSRATACRGTPSALRSLPRRIDLLLVDGPPAFKPEIELSRYPALPALAERLAPRRLRGAR
jgi:hypothetical protein